MAREQSANEPTELGSVLDALNDADARDIIRALDEPVTASEISDTSDIPLSTTYRKLNLLTDADLLLEGTEIRADGHHATTYEEVRILLTEERRLSVDIARTERSPDETLADIWTAVRNEI